MGGFDAFPYTSIPLTRHYSTALSKPITLVGLCVMVFKLETSVCRLTEAIFSGVKRPDRETDLFM